MGERNMEGSVSSFLQKSLPESDALLEKRVSAGTKELQVP
jgi:hypothetical protein